MSEKSYVGWYFLATVIFTYVIVGVWNPATVLTSLHFSIGVLKNIIPVFILVFSMMACVNYYVTPEMAAKYLGKSSGIKRWIVSVVGGIISTGPIYMWYPMLRELKKKGVSYGFIATFLYNRAVKIPLMPLLIYYFGIKFTVVLTFVMIFVSLIEGFIFEKLEGGGFL
ncbi:MAG: hypothetical protein J7L45_00015 [Candidatus Aenigmarchaeota archaeon]|nr:hypothetical protein [Candidatus Aenigmarchaeota archaeon]